MKRISLVMAAAILATAGQASAGVIVNDSFDGYANQAAFQAVWAPIGTVAPISAELSTAQAASGTQAVRVPGTGTNSQSRNQLSFTESGSIATNNVLTFSFDFYDANPTGSPQRNHVNLQDSASASATNQLVAMGFNNNQTGPNSGGQFYMGRILGYTVPVTADPDGGPTESVGGAGAFFKLNDFGVGQRSLGWHNLKVVISTDDGLSTDYAFYVDNQLAERVNNVGTAASIRSYDVIRLGSGLSNGSVEAFVDNIMVVTAVPEASSFLALGLAGLSSLGAVLYRKRRAAA